MQHAIKNKTTLNYPSAAAEEFFSLQRFNQDCPCLDQGTLKKRKKVARLKRRNLWKIKKKLITRGWDEKILWRDKSFLAVGVFQGCVLSPALFNTCFQPLLNALHHKAQTSGWSYTLKSNPYVQRDTSAYANNLQICSWSAASCQTQLDLTDGYLLWSWSMRARPNKCFGTFLALGSDGRYGRTDPALAIGGGRMTYLDDADFRYLGGPINTKCSEVDCRRLIAEKLRSFLEALNTGTLAASAKIWLYHHFVASKLSWSFLINDLCLTFVKKLQASATKSLKGQAPDSQLEWRISSLRPPSHHGHSPNCHEPSPSGCVGSWSCMHHVRQTCYVMPCS